MAALCTPNHRSHLDSAERQLEEVIVTANRREESNQRVPIGIAAFSADDAKKVGVTDAQSLAAVVPGLLFNRQANTSIPFLRGVGTPVGQSGDEPSVALYIDGVYVPAGSASMASFTSIDHIEVAKGPQGTLFGRNATGGVVQVFTRNPTDKPELEVTGGLRQLRHVVRRPVRKRPAHEAAAGERLRILVESIRGLGSERHDRGPGVQVARVRSAHQIPLE